MALAVFSSPSAMPLLLVDSSHARALSASTMVENDRLFSKALFLMCSSYGRTRR